MKVDLPALGIPTKACIGQQLQPQPDIHFFIGPARPMLGRRAVGRGLVRRIPTPAIAAFQEHDSLADFGQVKQQRALFIVREHLRANRQLDDKVFAISAVPVTPHALNAALCLEMLGIAEVDQGIEASDGFKNDVAALAAIAAIGTAILDIFLAPETDRPRPARTGANENFGLVEKMHGLPFRGVWPVLLAQTLGSEGAS